MKAPAPIIVRVESLTAQYGEHIILEDIHFDVHRGEVFAILGGSGEGKTTLLRCMIGLMEPLKGAIFIDGKNLVQTQGEDRLAVLSHMGVMFQSGALLGSMTLLENVRLPLEELTHLPKEVIDAIARNKLALVSLSDYADYYPAEISGGMVKRAAIARAMALEPSILFLDEPSAGLDPITSAQLDQLIVELSKTVGMTIIVVTHELPSVFAIAERCILLHDKKIVAIGNPMALKQQSENAWVNQFFNRKPEP
ncbi:MAG: polyamine ABC transporter ATP-binding protein [Gammaproteobacteria bacterium GWF2_41_13]|nr:MAG: polyamine ABC transporter ATP-binding protein [Gammaproteobacteria bacterium GWF2_41_13]